MVQIVENWAEIDGAVTDEPQSSAIPGFAAVKIKVARCNDVAGYPNLLSGREGGELEVFVATSTAARLKIVRGKVLRLRVRRGKEGRVFAHPDFVYDADTRRGAS